MAEADGANPSRLTDLALPRVDSPSWSPDGRQIAFVATADVQSDIYVVDTLGGTPVLLAPSPTNEEAPSWSRDNVTMYFASDRAGAWEIWKMDVRGGPPPG